MDLENSPWRKRVTGSAFLQIWAFGFLYGTRGLLHQWGQTSLAVPLPFMQVRSPEMLSVGLLQRLDFINRFVLSQPVWATGVFLTVSSAMSHLRLTQHLVNGCLWRKKGILGEDCLKLKDCSIFRFSPSSWALPSSTPSLKPIASLLPGPTLWQNSR